MRSLTDSVNYVLPQSYAIMPLKLKYVVGADMSGTIKMEVPEGTKRSCHGGDHKVVYHGIEEKRIPAGVQFTPGWHHISKDDWADHPHKAAPRKYVRRKANGQARGNTKVAEEA